MVCTCSSSWCLVAASVLCESSSRHRRLLALRDIEDLT